MIKEKDTLMGAGMGTGLEDKKQQVEVELSDFTLRLSSEVMVKPQITFLYRNKHYHLKPNQSNSQKNVYEYSHSIKISTQIFGQ